MSNLEVALEYLLEYKFSVVPWKPNKRGSLISTYKEFQGRLPTEEEVKEWWTKWPDAMIGVITGPVSDLMALDFDWYKLRDTEKSPLKDLVPDTIPGPICISPEGGHHKLFRYSENGTVINSTADILKGFDIRALKGVITMPPSINDKGLCYRWMGGRELGPRNALSHLNASILNKVVELINTKFKGESIKGPVADFNKVFHGITKHNIILDLGKRDETIFHIANHLVKGGMVKEDIFKTLEIIAKNCNPPFEMEEIPVKIESALNRAKDKDRNISEEIRKFISITNGSFSVSDVSQTITFHNKANIRATLHRFSKGDNAIIEPDKSRGDGWFRKIEKDETVIDWKNASDDYLDIKWPFKIERWFKTAPKNIIIVAGEPDAGKTAFLLNLAGLNNWSSMPTFYFSSEMGDSELKNRLLPFGPKPTWQQFRMKVIERSSNFADVIRPDAINIIDFLEIHDEFYKVGLYIKEIFDKLDKGIAVIALQKNPGKDQGLGGMRSIEKARLAINMERGNRTIIDKAKNWATMNNPRGLAINYKLVEGWKFEIENEKNGSGGWYYADGTRQIGAREEKQKQYQQQPFNNQF